MSEINLIYHETYKGKRFCVHESVDVDGNYCFYYFYNYGFNNYDIVSKVENKG